MWIEIIGLTLLSLCLGLPIKDKGHLEKKTFLCESSLDQKTIRKREAESPDSTLGLRSFLLSGDQKWPRSVVPYTLDPTFSQKQVQMIQNVMKVFSEVSCVKWVPRYMQRDYVSFVHSTQSNQCNSKVGRQGGEQPLNLGDDCFDVDNGYQGALAHEMMHAIGFIHEQQRIDRDCYVKVADQVSVVKKYDYGITEDTNTGFPYDFGSIMHYGKSEHMTSHRGERLGNYEGVFTEIDKMKLNNMYCGGKTFCELRPQECAQFLQVQQQCPFKG